MARGIINAPAKKNLLFKTFCSYSRLKLMLKPAFLSDELWLQLEMQAMKYYIEKGEDTNQLWENYHPLITIIDAQSIEKSEKKALLSFLIHNASSPFAAATEGQKITVHDWLKDHYLEDWNVFLKTEYDNYRTQMLTTYMEPL